MTRDEIDAIAWDSICKRARLDLSEARGYRPMNYREIGIRLQKGQDFQHAWSDFLHAFYDFRTESFFAYPSPESLSVEWQAILAGTAEFLSLLFELPVPAWVEDKRYFLPKLSSSTEKSPLCGV